MLNKQTTKTAEELAAIIEPLQRTAEKLAAKLQKASNETRHAHQVATAWQYPSHKIYSEEAGEDWEKIANLRETNAHEWSETLHAKYKELSKKETAEQCARLNYRNWIAYLCDTLANELHKGDTWAQFYEKKGLESLADFLREKLNTKNISIYRDGTGWDAFTSPRFYCYLNIKYWGYPVGAANWSTYAKTKEGDARQWTEPKAPKLYTIAQYIKLVQELKKLQNEAEAKAREHHDKARASGLIYFIGGLSSPKLEKWGKND